MLKTLFHLSVFVINASFLCYDQMYLELPMPHKSMENLPFKSRSMFLTIWCLVLQTIYHLVSFLNDIAGSNARAPKKPPVIRKIKDTLFSVAFTAAIYVSLAFWGIYAVDRDLIFPDSIAKIYTPLFNHIMHTTVSVFILIELLTSHINYPSRKVGLSALFSFKLLYLMWFFIIYVKTGAWPYPIFDKLNWPARFGFIAVSLYIAFIFYVIGEKINKVVSHSKVTYTNGTTKSKSKKS
ncbi:androgen-induced gene 1 protein-like [Danaus plexippus]|uniref:androgen-induced gene 1 protein-like n=1 Tax=Danaus plexippus TaxID=13037 RepID=UPI002AAFE863|nr:androgen-induced gene 1 protein-like [Danaus plexippus]